MIFDTHAHYDDEQFDKDRHDLLASMKESGIGHIVNIGADMYQVREPWNLPMNMNISMLQ